ncbi:MAG: hypothetical protein N3F05_01865 [Candidatus Diapherotrites archaeon]|nr:hypothetical protein [Candidatus Diapherotrites archaeon]
MINMLGALSGSLGMMFKRPFALVPVFITMFALANISVFFQLELLDFIYLISTKEAPLSNPFHALSYFYSVNPKGLFYIVGYAFLSLAVFLLVSIYYCRIIISKEKKISIISALAFAIGSLWNAIVLSGIMFLVFVSAFTLFFVVALLPIPNLYLYFGLIALFLLIFLIICIRLFTFVMPALAEEKTNAKQALKKNWAFVNNHFWATVLLCFILLLVLLLTALLYNIVVEPFDDNITIFAIFSAFGTFNSAFCIGALALYYSKHKK